MPRKSDKPTTPPEKAEAAETALTMDDLRRALAAQRMINDRLEARIDRAHRLLHKLWPFYVAAQRFVPARDFTAWVLMQEHWHDLGEAEQDEVYAIVTNVNAGAKG